MKKITIFLIIFLILIFGGIFIWGIFQKGKIPPPKKAITKEVVTEKVFSLAGTVTKVDTENKFLRVKPVTEGDEVKVIVNSETEIFKLKKPTNQTGKIFALDREKITLENIKIGDKIFIKTNLNIFQKKEFNGVDYIEVLP